MKLKIEVSERQRSMSGREKALKYAFQVLEVSEDVSPLRIYKPPLLGLYRNCNGTIFVKTESGTKRRLTSITTITALELLRGVGVNPDEYLFCDNARIRKFIADLLS